MLQHDFDVLTRLGRHRVLLRARRHDLEEPDELSIVRPCTQTAIVSTLQVCQGVDATRK